MMPGGTKKSSKEDASRIREASMFIRSVVACIMWAALAEPAGAAADGPSCARVPSPSAASAPSTNCQRARAAVPHVAPAPAVTNQTYVYCGAATAASGPGGTTASVNLAFGASAVASGASAAGESPEGSCKRTVDIKLGKDFGLSVSNLGTTETWFVLALGAILLLASLPVAAKAFGTRKEAEVKSAAGNPAAAKPLEKAANRQMFVALGLLVVTVGFAGVGGYMLGSIGSETRVLTDAQVEHLQTSNALAKAVMDELATRIDRLQQQNEGLEKELAAARVEAGASAAAGANRAWILFFAGMICGVAALAVGRWFKEDRQPIAPGEPKPELQSAASPSPLHVAAVKMLDETLETLNNVDPPGDAPDDAPLSELTKGRIRLARELLSRALSLLK
jgi:hypothetical protein